MFGRRKKRKKKKESPPRFSPGQAAEDELRSHFTGRRKGQRARTSYRVVLFCGPYKLRSTTVDLSCSGALLRVDDPAFELDFQTFTLRVSQLMSDGVVISFGGGAVKRSMEVVRTTMGGLGGEQGPLIACRFLTPLEPEACDVLGVEARDRNRTLEIMLMP